jgi:hypothetical protein
VKTDHILFIASGAFHTCKPSDLLAELQGRLPIRVELKGLTEDDMYRILTEPATNLIAQQVTSECGERFAPRAHGQPIAAEHAFVAAPWVRPLPIVLLLPSNWGSELVYFRIRLSCEKKVASARLF